MRKLILIKHAPPQVNPAEPPQRWRLSEKGRALCAPLADRLAPHGIGRIIASDEPKASETAELVAKALGIPWSTAPGLHEHDRSNVPHMPSGQFISMVELFFRRPDKLVLGKESADAAARRFAKAVDDVIDSSAEETLAVVSHGTVISLLLQDRSDANPFQMWRQLGLPSYVVLELPSYRIVETVERV